MIRKIAVIVLLSAFFTTAYSQETTPKKKGIARPDIPGTFVLELGVNSAPKAPSRFDKGFWGSRTFNVYYQYDIRVLKSRFSVVPGIGLSLERFKFVNGYTIKHNGDSLAMLSPSQAGYPGMRKSQLVTNFVEMPIEICYRSNPEDPGRSFKISAGYRIGYLYDAFTKIKYKEGSAVKQIKDKQFYDLSRFRHGIYGKVGLGNFSLFTYYNLNNLFEKGKGPVQNGQPSDFNTFTIGISLASF
ncbi:MAG TPA: hypothetical protein VGK59_06245 [Ohtaekwangia sp.]